MPNATVNMLALLRLWVQGDNTVRELKNQLSGQLLSMMIVEGLINEGGHHHLPMGHTHEDIGFLLNDCLSSCCCEDFVPCQSCPYREQ